MEAVKTTAEGATQIATKNVKAFGTAAANADLKQLNIRRRKPTAHDVEIEILYCGVCYSDLHTAGFRKRRKCSTSAVSMTLFQILK
jgi:alcohol dehydrogenase (NADP+)